MVDRNRIDLTFDMVDIERQAWNMRNAIRGFWQNVVEEFSLLKQDVASIKKFAHPGHNLRKTVFTTEAR